MALGFDGLSPRRVPNDDRSDDGSESEDEAEIAEENELPVFHEISWEDGEGMPSPQKTVATKRRTQPSVADQAVGRRRKAQPERFGALACRLGQRLLHAFGAIAFPHGLITDDQLISD